MPSPAAGRHTPDTAAGVAQAGAMAIGGPALFLLAQVIFTREAVATVADPRRPAASASAS